MGRSEEGFCHLVRGGGGDFTEKGTGILDQDQENEEAERKSESEEARETAFRVVQLRGGAGVQGAAWKTGLEAGGRGRGRLRVKEPDVGAGVRRDLPLQGSHARWCSLLLAQGQPGRWWGVAETSTCVRICPEKGSSFSAVRGSRERGPMGPEGAPGLAWPCSRSSQG